MKFLSAKPIFIISSVLLPVLAMSQSPGTNTNGTSYATSIPTAVPFLNITPDSRSGALGEAGVALSPDVNANYWNPAKLAFLNNNDNISLSYSPWLRQLVPDVSLSYLSYAHRIDERNSVGAALRYFNYGSIQLVDNNLNNQGTYTPAEFSLNGSFARKFGEELSLGLTVGFVHSSLSNAFFATGTGQQAKAGNALSAGVSLFYTRPVQELGTDGTFSFGTNISNIGSKMSYSTGGPQYFLPANLKIGAANTLNLDDYNQLTLTIDLNRLLVPAPPLRDANGNIIKGRDDNVSVPAGIFGSFTDAPDGFRGELKETALSSGLEYWYDRQFALRAGYYYQSRDKGGTHYLTTGFGLKYDGYNFDFSYLAASQRNSPLANTLRFTISAGFGGDKNRNKR